MTAVFKVICLHLCIGVALLLPAQPSRGGQLAHPQGYSITCPEGWSCWAASGADGPLVLTNKPYLHGGVLPAGGAEITVRQLPPGETTATALDSLHGEKSRRSKTSVKGGGEALRLEQDEDLHVPGEQYKYISVAAGIGGKAFLTRLTYHAGDRHADEFEKVLQRVVDSITSSEKEVQ
jgi:hypothetical protein